MKKACSIACIFALTAAASAADWPTWHGGTSRNGSADGKPGPKRAKVLWGTPEKEQSIGGPAIVGGKAFTGAGGEGVLCLELDKVIIDGKSAKAVSDPPVAPEYAALLDKELTVQAGAAAWAKEFDRQLKAAAKEGLPPNDL